ncbi:MAG: 5-formyltetrahydrofolate cyclo-ligase [Candidatus Gottesmanbacteria bacterium]
MSSITVQKQILRKQILGLRRAFTGIPKAKADRLIFHHITHHHLYQNAHTICTYVSMHEEVDTHALIQEILTKKEKVLIVPKTEGGVVYLYQINSYEDLEKGSFGILEPRKHCLRVDVSTVDLFIIAGLAFGRDGTRIGWGKGFYDRLLKNVTVPTIGVAYSFQVFDSVPATAEDKRVDIIISDM